MKNRYRRRSCTSKTAKIRRFVRFVMYCFITTVPVAFYCERSDEIVHYIYICCFLFPCIPKLGASNIP